MYKITVFWEWTRILQVGWHISIRDRTHSLASFKCPPSNVLHLCHDINTLQMPHILSLLRLALSFQHHVKHDNLSLTHLSNTRTIQIGKLVMKHENCKLTRTCRLRKQPFSSVAEELTVVVLVLTAFLSDARQAKEYIACEEVTDAYRPVFHEL